MQNKSPEFFLEFAFWDFSGLMWKIDETIFSLPVFFDDSSSGATCMKAAPTWEGAETGEPAERQNLERPRNP